MQPMEAFSEALERGRLTPLARELPFSDPAAIYGRLRSEHSVLLDSVKGPPNLARYSIIALDPYLIFRAKDGNVELQYPDPASGGAEGSRFKRSVSQRPLRMLRELMNRVPAEPHPDIPFIGGAVGLISYDFVRYLEKIPCTTVDDLRIPDAHLLFTDSVVTVDHMLGKAWASVLPGLREGHAWPGGESGMIRPADVPASYDAAASRLADICARLEGVAMAETPAPMGRSISIEHEMPESGYHRIVKRAKEYIAAGDIFQANLSQRLKADIRGMDPWRIYLTLRRINPSPFAAYADMGDYVIASSSPERLVKSDGRVVETRPIAGTRPRGSDADGDRRMRADLLINEKERAEHIMLIDLERNDLGKISAYGTVEVDELMVTEDYSHVIHIVSNVRGRLLEGKGAVDVIRAVFPGGTITGVPKVRCMEIIDELEPVCRGPYTGSMGYLGFDGRLDLNIIIRTFVIKDGFAYVQAGAGIVADSDPAREYHETLKKAEALIRTVERL